MLRCIRSLGMVRVMIAEEHSCGGADRSLSQDRVSSLVGTAETRVQLVAQGIAQHVEAEHG